MLGVWGRGSWFGVGVGKKFGFVVVGLVLRLVESLDSRVFVWSLGLRGLIGSLGDRGYLGLWKLVGIRRVWEFGFVEVYL